MKLLDSASPRRCPPRSGRSERVCRSCGTYQAVTLVGDWRKKGLQMVVIGLGAAVIGFLIGRLFHTAGS